MTFTKILCPTDFSEGAQQALRVAAHLARANDAELVILHVAYMPASMFTLEVPFPPDVAQRWVDDAQRVLDGAVKDAVSAGASRVSGTLVTGVPWMEIVKQLDHHAIDLCVIGTRGRTGLARILLGSVAAAVIRHAPCSVLAVRPDGKVEPFRHALVPTDFSAGAEHALDLAAQLVEPTGAITLLHVVEVPAAISGEVPAAFARDVDKRATAALDKDIERIKRTTAVRVTAHTRIGYPGAQTLAALDHDRTVDLVVMGSHGRTGITRILLGSVAEKVVRHAHCPVLVARQRT